jgi:hypothetical protein
MRRMRDSLKDTRFVQKVTTLVLLQEGVSIADFF